MKDSDFRRNATGELGMDANGVHRQFRVRTGPHEGDLVFLEDGIPDDIVGPYTTTYDSLLCVGLWEDIRWHDE